MRLLSPDDPLPPNHPRRFAVAGPAGAAGNVEGPLRTFLTDPDHIVKQAWRGHAFIRARVRRLLAEDRHPDLVVVRLRGQWQVDRWLAGPFAHALEG